MTASRGTRPATRGRARRGRRITPGIVFLSVALIGAVAFFAYVITVRDASQIPLLSAGAAAVGLVFLALAAYMLRSTWKAGVAARNGRAVALGLGGGIAAIIGMMFLSLAVIGFLLARSG